MFYHKGLIIISDKARIIDVETEKALMDELVSRVNVLPTVGSYANLKALIEKVSKSSYGGYDDIRLFDSMKSIAGTTNAAKTEQAAEPSTSVGSDYSKTNVQVEGVDEADVVKTDGEFIYQVNKQRIVVMKASPAEEMKIISVLDFADKKADSMYGYHQGFNPQEIYVDDKYLVIIGSAYDQVVVPAIPQVKVEAKMMPPIYNYRNTVKAIIYDLKDKSHLKKLREVEVEGNYTSSRKIGSSLYMVSNKNVGYYHIMENENNIIPMYRDTKVKRAFVEVKPEDIRYFPGFLQPNYMMIAALDLDSNNPVNVSTYLGASENIYASTENLYVASTNYNYTPMFSDTVKPSILPRYNDSNNTLVYKFSLNKQNVDYKGKADVPGSILNQFSMDEYNGNFRIATTVGNVWGTGENVSKNNMYVLDKDLNITGKIENIAPGEKIYSVRFMGQKAYMVTFKKVDPLFVIDLADPKAPKILGKLKIPGYSDYLHPYDENHIIGFGKDAVEAKEGDFAWYQGMKIAMFDVTDVNNPKEMFVEMIGDRGTESELLHNHKALLFSKEKNLMAFPVTVMKVNPNQQQNPSWGPAYGEFEYQGAYVYNVDIVNGFKLKGRVTHISDEEYLKAGSYWYDGEKMVQRILYIGEKLYTLSNGMVKANDINDIKEVGKLIIP